MIQIMISHLKIKRLIIFLIFSFQSEKKKTGKREKNEKKLIMHDKCTKIPSLNG